MNDNLKKSLLEEKSLLEKELSQVAKKDAKGDWVPTIGDKDQSQADESQVADSFENLENNMGVTTRLENRLTDINAALEKMENGKFGICETCGEKIEEDRLEANPAARTCKAHM